MASKKQSKNLRKGKKVEHTKALAVAQGGPISAGWDVKGNVKA